MGKSMFSPATGDKDGPIGLTCWTINAHKADAPGSTARRLLKRRIWNLTAAMRARDASTLFSHLIGALVALVFFSSVSLSLLGSKPSASDTFFGIGHTSDLLKPVQ